ncbi:MAG: accessory gene regulator B family protein [Acetatifactor sp.]
MERISEQIVWVLIEKGYVERESYEVYKYGLTMCVEIALSFLTTLSICLLFGRLIEGIIFFLVFIPLRTYVGGFHMKSYKGCFALSLGAFLLVLFLSGVNIFSTVFSLTGVFGASFFLLICVIKDKRKGRDTYLQKAGLGVLGTIFLAILFTAFGYPNLLRLVAFTALLASASKALER